MAQIVVRKLEDEVKDGLRRRAARHGRSLEAEVRQILRDAAGAEKADVDDNKIGLGTWLSRQFAGIGLRVGEEIEEIEEIGDSKPPTSVNDHRRH
jgi:plasmid stability protein